MKNNLQPKLRFKNYEGDWNFCKLGELGSVEMCKRIFKQQTTIQGDIPFYKIGTFGRKPDAFINQELFEEFKFKYPYPEMGDILISASGTIGRTVIYNGENAYYQDSNIVWLKRDKDKIDNSFLYQFYQIAKWAGTEGSTIKRLYNSNILNTDIYLPVLEEQIKIGTFLKHLDETIAFHQQELDTLKQTKQGFLQKMFPKEGETVPEVRFPNFTEHWKVRSMGEIVNITTGKLDANAMKDNGLYDFYTSGTKKYKIDIPAFKGPAITIAGNGATVGFMHLADGEFNAYQRTYVLTNFEAIREFLFYEIAKKLPKKINQQARKGNIPYIVMDMLTELKVSLPSIEEQVKIGEFFKQLDKTIELHEKELEALKETKKAFLQKMFV